MSQTTEEESRTGVQGKGCLGRRFHSLLLQMSYEMLHACSQACFITTVCGQSHLHDIFCVSHFKVAHD